MKAEAWSALGTFLAVVAALGIAISGPLVRRWQRPKLTLEVGAVEPFAVLGGPDLLHYTKTTLRLRVRNDGRSEALGVRAVPLHWWVKDKTGDWEWAEVLVDPTPFSWASLRGCEESDLVDLAPGQHDFIEIVERTRNEGTHRLLGGSPTFDRDYGSFKERAEHRVEVAVFLANARSSNLVIRYQFSIQSIVDFAEPSRPPDAVAPPGLLNLLTSAGQDASDS